jgi:FAD:protein FMN transferase
MSRINSHEFRRVERLMGNRFEITVVAEDEQSATGMFDIAITEIRRIEHLFTTYQVNSQVNQVNAAAGLSAVKVDHEVVALIERCLRISAVTDGAFDITYGSIDRKLWNFDTTMTSLPDAKTAREMVKLIDYKKVIVDTPASTVFLREKGMRIGFGGIGKGYAADRARTLLIDKGVTGGIINAAGDIAAWGSQADGRPWTVGIASPDNANLPFSWLSISDMAIATSGNYEKYVVIDGRKYSHTINPKTGLPVTGIKSVSILTKSAELADALATPVTVMGIKSGLHLINQLNLVECIIIDDNNRIYTSKNIKLHEPTKTKLNF